MSSLIPNKTSDESSADELSLETPTAGKIEAIKPEILLGISTYTPKLDPVSEQGLDARFSAPNGARCESCGVSLTEDFRHKSFLSKAWYNTCGMCHYTANLDKIPHYDEGWIIYFPYLSQARLNATLRAIWCVDYMRTIEPENQELELMAGTIDGIRKVIAGQETLTAGCFANTDPRVYASTMYLLKPEEYKQRYKLFESFRWLPEKRVFEDDVAFWTETDYNVLHPEKISSNITNFMSHYAPRFKIKE